MRFKDLTKQAIRYRGDWSSSAHYEVLDYVRYTDGCGYVSLVAVTGVAPDTDAAKWTKAVEHGAAGDPLLNTKIAYAASDISVSGLAWDALHVFPEMPSLELTMATVPSDGKGHQIVIQFTTPADLTSFVWSFDPAIKWANNANLGLSLAPSKTYLISVDSGSMIATYCSLTGTATTREMLTPTAIALPVGGTYRVQFFSEIKPTVLEYSSSNTSVLTVDNNGIVRGMGEGTATVTVTWAGLSKQITVYVGEEIMDSTSVPTQDRTIDEIEIINPRATLEVGDEYALYAVGISNNLAPKYDIEYYNPIKWSSSDPSVATVHFGTLVGVGTGTCTITATDLNENASASFSLSVVAAQTPTATDAETYIPTIDNTGQTDVTADIETALTYAAANSFKKVSFPNGTYLMNGDNRPNGEPIEIPSNLIVDFNGSMIRFEEGDATEATYTMFRITDKENVWLLNANFYAENYERETLLRKESCRTLQIYRASKNIRIENCTFAWSPGFNVSIGYARENRNGFRNVNVEAGGFDANGNPIEAAATWRTPDFTRLYLTSRSWVLGNFDGYQITYLRSRLYDIYFYDAEYNFLFRRKNCYQYQSYDFPAGVTPQYAKISFFQTDAPTESIADWYSYIMICDRYNPKDIYFKNCTFSNAISTGLSPQGGEHIVVDGCTFIDNGYQDPLSQIDWEDGMQTAQGHIIKNCDFLLDKNVIWYNGAIVSGQIINTKSRNITLHDNSFSRCQLRSLEENVYQRAYHNKFEGNNITIKAKMDAVYAGNISDRTASVTDGEGNTHIINADNELLIL